MKDRINLADKYNRIDKDTIVHNGNHYSMSQSPTDDYSTRRLVIDLAVTRNGGNFSTGSILDNGQHIDASLGTAIIQKFFNWLENPTSEDYEFLDHTDFQDSGFKYKLLGVSEEELISKVKPIPIQKQVAIAEPEVIVVDDLRETAKLITEKATRIYEETQPEAMKEMQGGK